LTGTAAAAFALGAAVSWRRAAGRVATSEHEVERTERTLRDQEDNADRDRHVQDVVLATMEEGILLVDREGTVVFANDALARHLAATPTTLNSLLPLDLRRAVQRAGYIGHVERCEVETGTPARWLRGTAIPLSDEGTVLLVVADVTETRRLDAVRRDFVANASHELKTPAASIQAAAETLRHAVTEDPAALPRFAAQLERDALGLSRIVSDLLDLSRLESGSDLDEWVRPDIVTREEAGRFDDAVATSGVDLVLDVAEVPAVRGSQRDLSLLVRNLIDNAIRYADPEGGRVEVSVVADDTAVRLRVADNGAGIPTRDLGRIFERFYRVDRARSRETGGTGLGLAIVKHVAENHGGDVTVESELGRGSTFTVRIPSTA
jgi:signal transduction histidine kinase